MATSNGRLLAVPGQRQPTANPALMTGRRWRRPTARRSTRTVQSCQTPELEAIDVLITKRLLAVQSGCETVERGLDGCLLQGRVPDAGPKQHRRGSLRRSRAGRQRRLLNSTSAWAARVGGIMVYERCPNAQFCLDPFHVVQWATDALDQIRRELWNQARQRDEKGIAKTIKGTRYAPWKTSLAEIAKLNHPLHRAYLLKEELPWSFSSPTTRTPSFFCSTGLAAAASNPSSSWPRPSATTCRSSRPPSLTASPGPASSQ